METSHDPARLFRPAGPIAHNRQKRQGSGRLAGEQAPAKGRGCPVDQENGKSFYRYKNHVSVDVKYKLMRSYAVTDAALHDSNVFEQLLADNTSKDVWADSDYRSEERLEHLAQEGFSEHIQRKGSAIVP
jgi:IS5 family transposase